MAKYFFEFVEHDRTILFCYVLQTFIIFKFGTSDFNNYYLTFTFPLQLNDLYIYQFILKTDIRII